MAPARARPPPAVRTRPLMPAKRRAAAAGRAPRPVAEAPAATPRGAAWIARVRATAPTPPCRSRSAAAVCQPVSVAARLVVRRYEVRRPHRSRRRSRPGDRPRRVQRLHEERRLGRGADVRRGRGVRGQAQEGGPVARGQHGRDARHADAQTGSVPVLPRRLPGHLRVLVLPRVRRRLLQLSGRRGPGRRPWARGPTCRGRRSAPAGSRRSRAVAPGRSGTGRCNAGCTHRRQRGRPRDRRPVASRWAQWCRL